MKPAATVTPNQWTLMCPDGYIWADDSSDVPDDGAYTSLAAVKQQNVSHCCDGRPHTIIARLVTDWKPA